ncbi:MAG: hypothetical protein KBT46_00945 [Ruminococcus sp.]|nr:hypothetical protein [Candidatus Copronaster equi]
MKRLLPLKGKAIETKFVELVETETEYIIIAHFDDKYTEHINKLDNFSLIIAIDHFCDKMATYFKKKADLYNRSETIKAIETLRGNMIKNEQANN